MGMIAVKMIHFKHLGAADTVFIRTANSLYQLTVDDPGGRRVKLRGGLLGERWAEVMLDWGAGQLRTGLPALFFIREEGGGGVLRVNTSAVVGLSLLRRIGSGDPLLSRCG